LNTFAANVMKGNLKICVVAPPSFGYKQHELMHDIAVSVGATYFSEKTGDDLSLINYADLGRAKKIVVSSNKTIIIKNDTQDNQDVIDERVAQLWASHAMANKKNDKDFLLERIASLTGGIGVIHVGGNTDLEQKELYDRVDDAVCAVRSALEEGILPGAGMSLAYMVDDKLPDGSNKEYEVAQRMLNLSLLAPMTQIIENAGLCVNNLYNGREQFGEGVNIKTGEKGDLIKLGVIDPFKVTRSALQNAVSVAVTILSTNAVITMARAYEMGEGPQE
jgi:chaperonin GroEL